MAADSSGGGAVVAVDLASGAQDALTEPGEVSTPVGIAFDAQGDLLVTHRQPLPNFEYEAQVVRIDPQAADPEPGALLENPEGLAAFVPEPGASGAALAALSALAALGAHRARVRSRARRAR